MNFWDKAHVLHRAWRYRLRTERACMRFALRNLMPGQTALDIGAHKGVYAYWMCKQVGPTGRVVGFEPQPGLAAYVERLKQAFHLNQLSVVASALSSTAGSRNLYLPHVGLPGEATLEQCPDAAATVAINAIVLDDYLDKHGVRPVHFIKCDVEGHELEVFRGGQRMLREDHPVVMFECQDFRSPQGQTGQVFEFLDDLGYEGSFFEGNRLVPVTEFRASIHQAAGGRYLDNFAFVPRRGQDARRRAA